MIKHGSQPDIPNLPVSRVSSPEKKAVAELLAAAQGRRCLYLFFVTVKSLYWEVSARLRYQSYGCGKLLPAP